MLETLASGGAILQQEHCSVPYRFCAEPRLTREGQRLSDSSPFRFTPVKPRCPD